MFGEAGGGAGVAEGGVVGGAEGGGAGEVDLHGDIRWEEGGAGAGGGRGGCLGHVGWVVGDEAAELGHGFRACFEAEGGGVAVGHDGVAVAEVEIVSEV